MAADDGRAGRQSSWQWPAAAEPTAAGPTAASCHWSDACWPDSRRRQSVRRVPGRQQSSRRRSTPATLTVFEQRRGDYCRQQSGRPQPRRLQPSAAGLTALDGGRADCSRARSRWQRSMVTGRAAVGRGSADGRQQESGRSLPTGIGLAAVDRSLAGDCRAGHDRTPRWTDDRQRSSRPASIAADRNHIRLIAIDSVLTSDRSDELPTSDRTDHSSDGQCPMACPTGNHTRLNGRLSDSCWPDGLSRRSFIDHDRL